MDLQQNPSIACSTHQPDPFVKNGISSTLGSMESVYWLSGETRSKIIEQLAKNNGILFQYAANNEVVGGLMAQNKQLIEKLSGLRPASDPNPVQSSNVASVRSVNGVLGPVNHNPAGHVAMQDDPMQSDAPANEKQANGEESSDPRLSRHDLEVLKDEIMGEVAEMIESGEYDCSNEEMKEDIESLKSEITMLKSKLNQVDIFKAKAIHSFQLKMLAQFFETGDDHMSEHFYCQGLPFCAYLRVHEEVIGDKRRRYLSFYVNCVNNCDYSNWSIDTRIELKIFNPRTARFVKLASFNCTFGVQTVSSIGKSEFISYEDLTHPNYGYVQNDSIRLNVKLEADSVVRKNQGLEELGELEG